MKTRIILSLIFSTLTLCACSSTPNATTPTSIPVPPTEAKPTITQTSVPPTLTSIPTLVAKEEKPIDPGIYPVYWKEGAANIVFPSGQTQVLLHLYDESTYVSPSGNIYGLRNTSRDTIPSPDGKIITYMNMEDGFLYNFDWQSKSIQKIAQPDSGSFVRDWVGSWAPEGNFLLYAIDHGTLEGFPSIFIENIAQDTYARLTNWDTVETAPVWSPDSQWIAFASDHAKFGLPNGEFAGATDIYVMSTKCVSNIETCKDSYIKQLTFTGIQGDALDPLWNPNGSNLAYSYIDGQTGLRDIYLTDLNGNVKNLTNTPDFSEDIFGWSPDGESLVFRRKDFASGTDMYTLNIANGAITRITNSPETDEGIPFWSPDGKEIAFDEDVNSSDGGIVIYSIKEDRPQILDGSYRGGFLFWLTVFPEISNGTTLTVSPSGHDLNIRSEASIAGYVVGKLQSGDTFTILDQPVENGQYTWWKIKSDQGEGWIVQNYNWVLPNPTANQ